MKNNKLIIYEKSIFRKISEFFKNIFSKKKTLQNEDVIINNDKKWAFGHDMKNSHLVHNVDLRKLGKECILKPPDDSTCFFER